MHTLRRIAVGSAFKVGAALSALLFAVLGFFVVLLPGIFGASILGALLRDQGGGGAGIGFAIEAWLYNIVAGWIGGLEVELS
ncbi:MAG: hypothetical protein CVU38_07640 [Chloroflexi bacterium HGW-Chloroflexi-1]|nr:MAG: hypothetical protein CVU38_07640 [Chloroflexi bacterium HGW-Chloroflexi-1]